MAPLSVAPAREDLRIQEQVAKRHPAARALAVRQFSREREVGLLFKDCV